MRRRVSDMTTSKLEPGRDLDPARHPSLVEPARNARGPTLRLTHGAPALRQPDPSNAVRTAVTPAVS